MSSKPIGTTLHVAAAILAVALAAVSPLYGQAEKPLTWLQDLNYLESISKGDIVAQQNTVADIRVEVQRWIDLHPNAGVTLPEAPARPWNAEQTANQIQALHQTVELVIKQDPDHPFHLGVVNVNVNAAVSAVSPLSDSIDQTEIAEHNEVNAALAMESLPGVSIQHSYGGRNQEMVSIHGFNYLQVPLYVDGILMNDPYDGTLDYRQIPTSDIAEIQVAKGFSSSLLGPNAVGGAINILTKEPQKKFEGEMLVGGSSGDGFLSSLRLGSRTSRFFVQGSLDWQQADYVPLSGNFVTNALQPNDHLNHSDSQNAKYSGRVGWTPHGKGEYVFSYMNQKANDGIPLATGNDPLDGTGCGAGATVSTCYFRSSYRRWGYWDKTSYYFHSDTPLGENSSLKLRVFYDEYPNLMYFYTGLPYSAATLNTSPGWITTYDDHADGFSSEFGTKLLPRNAISGMFYFKDDTHRTVPLFPYSSGPAWDSDRQQTASIGLQDFVTILPNFTATGGISIDHLDGLRASDDQTYYAFVAPQCPTNTDPNNFKACTPHRWAYNPQVSLAYSFKDSGRLFFGFAQKSRFPSLKEMYSYRMGSGLPNPNLQTEHSNNWQIGYSRDFGAHTVAQLEFFRSDLKDAIEFIPVPVSELPASCGNGAYACSMNENASQETHEGVELRLHTTPVHRLTFDANYTYVNKKINGYTFQGQQIYDYPCGGGYLVEGTGANAQQTQIANNTCLTPTDLPKHKAVATATLRLPAQAMLISTLRYESGTKAIDSYSVGPRSSTTYYYEVIPMSNYATWDLGGSMPIYKGAVIQAGVKNLLDRNYYTVLEYSEEGRNWFINLRFRF